MSMGPSISTYCATLIGTSMAVCWANHSARCAALSRNRRAIPTVGVTGGGGVGGAFMVGPSGAHQVRGTRTSWGGVPTV